MIDFDRVWKTIIDCLNETEYIPYWSKYGRTRDNSFRINSVHYTKIIVEPESTGNLRILPRQEFYEIWKLYEDYLNDRIKRNQLTKISANTSYILSIIHYCIDK